MLLDGNGLIYRGYFALINVPLSTSKGELVNAVFGFSNIVLRGFQDVRPDYVAIAFDLPAPTFRHEQYAEYKATRRPMPDDLRAQFPKVREVVAALRLPVYELAGFEADDVIGTLTREAEGRDLATTIVTGDLDMLQLVTERTRLMTTRMGVDATVVYDPARIQERYGLAASQMVDFKALKGDSTDNIPGVPGVGDKTAARLVGQFGDLDALYAHLDEVTPEKLRDKLREHHDRVVASRAARHDPPGPAGGARPGRRPFRRLRPRRGGPALPGVRVQDADRSAPAAARGRRCPGGGGRGSRAGNACGGRRAAAGGADAAARWPGRRGRSGFRCGTRRAPGLRQSRGAARRPSQRERRRPAARARFRLRRSDRRTGRGDPSRARATARG